MAEHNPYVGPRPFTTDERRLFFGRAEEIEILTGLVVARRASLLYAQSGAGKSSLLLAGLAPRLLFTERVVRGHSVVRPLVRGVRIARVGRGIEEQRPSNIFVQSALLSQPSDITPKVGPGATLETALRSWLSTATAEAAAGVQRLPFVLVFDQFEELFTRHLGFRDQREDFFLQVSKSLESHDALRVLFSMREDYLAELTPFAHLLPDHLRPRFRLERLKTAAAVEAVAEPARRASPSRPFKPGIAEALVANLMTPQADDIEPILLQVVCKRLWTALPQDKREIGSEDTAKHADVDRALIEYYNDAVKSVVDEAKACGRPVAERRVRRAIRQQLITPGLTRAIVFRDEESGLTAGLPNAAIDVLIRSDVNVLRGEVRGGGRWYELAHDRLIRPVLVATEEWESQNATPLSTRAVEWNQRGRRDQDLLQRLEVRAEEARLRSTPDEPLTPLEEEFLSKTRLRLAGASATQRLNIEDLGWGVVFAETDPQRDQVRGALRELLDHRRRQTESRFPKTEFQYKPGESAQRFLARHGVRSTPGAGTDEIPYYVLIVGDPESIPFEFQYGLALQCAVGRLCFDGLDVEETLLMYACYARSVVESETGSWALPRQAVVFCPAHESDQATDLAAKQLVRPMLEELQRSDLSAEPWEVAPVVGELATKEGLKRLMGGDRTPALLFVAAHGMSYPNGHPSQQPNQGSIVCSDWTGSTSPLEAGALLSAEDVVDSAALLGLVTFLFVSYSAGTPKFDSMPQGAAPQQTSPRAFVSRLSQRLLGHPNGGALAVIGHVDRNWAHPIQASQMRGNEGYRTFVNIMARLIRGHSVGSAMEFFSSRYRQVVSELVDSMITPEDGKEGRSGSLIVEVADLRNYIVLGDPAVRVPVEGVVGQRRPVIRLDPRRLDELRATHSGTSQAVLEDTTGTGSVADTPGAEAATTSVPAPIDQERAVFNGIDVATGHYFYDELPVGAFIRRAVGLESGTPSEAFVDDYREAGSAFLRFSDAS